MAKTLITATTSAVTSKASYSVCKPPVTVFAVGLAGAETCSFYISPDHGTTWQTLGMEEGDGTPAALTLTATRTAVKIDFPCYLGVTKAATTGAAGVYVADDEDL